MRRPPVASDHDVIAELEGVVQVVGQGDLRRQVAHPHGTAHRRIMALATTGSAFAVGIAAVAPAPLLTVPRMGRMDLASTLRGME